MQMVEINIQFCTQFCLSLTCKRSAECQACAVPAGGRGRGQRRERGCHQAPDWLLCWEHPGQQVSGKWEGVHFGGGPRPGLPGNSSHYPFTLKMCFTSLTFSVITLFQTQPHLLELSLYLPLHLSLFRHFEKWGGFSTVVKAHDLMSPFSSPPLLVLQIASFLGGVTDVLSTFPSFSSAHWKTLVNNLNKCSTNLFTLLK